MKVKYAENYKEPEICPSYVERYNKSNRWARRPRVMHPKDTEECSRPGYYYLEGADFPRFYSPYYDSDWSDSIGLPPFLNKPRKRKKRKRKKSKSDNQHQRQQRHKID